MAVVNITIKNGLFEKCNGVKLEIFSSKFLSVNGWECEVQNNGVIKCTAKELCIDGSHSMRYTIYQNGFAKLTLKTPNEPVKVIKMGFVVKKGESFGNGVLGLSDGFIDHRYTFFREESFQKFLCKYGITAVLHEDPNRIFCLRNGESEDNSYYMNLWTDGHFASIGNQTELLNSFGKKFPGLVECISVNDAKWTLIRRVIRSGNKEIISMNLFTVERNLDLLVGLPKLV
jgi:hypothetical protein